MFRRIVRDSWTGLVVKTSKQNIKSFLRNCSGRPGCLFFICLIVQIDWWQLDTFFAGSLYKRSFSVGFQFCRLLVIEYRLGLLTTSSKPLLPVVTSSNFKILRSKWNSPWWVFFGANSKFKVPAKSMKRFQRCGGGSKFALSYCFGY